MPPPIIVKLSGISLNSNASVEVQMRLLIGELGKETGEVYRETGRSLLVYKKHEGQWKIAADIDQVTPDVTWPAPSGLE